MTELGLGQTANKEKAADAADSKEQWQHSKSVSGGLFCPVLTFLSNFGGLYSKEGPQTIANPVFCLTISIHAYPSSDFGTNDSPTKYYHL
jgi:hypothetical protein